MAGVVQNLVYRVSVSAIVGAIVAGGLIYLNNDRVVRSYRAEQSAQAEQQDMTNKALTEANESIASAINELVIKQSQQVDNLNETISALEAKIDAISVVEPANYSEIITSIDGLNADLTSKLDAMVPAVQEQN